jgi:hypothetical protein
MDYLEHILLLFKNSNKYHNIINLFDKNIFSKKSRIEDVLKILFDEGQ